MAIYGNTISFGGGGSNDTLPPLLDNFKATRLEGGIVPPTANTLAFKDIPDGSKIKLVKGSNISGTVTYGTTTDLNHRIVFDSNDWTRKQFQLENDSGHNNISVSDIDQWLNSTKASNWWREGGERDLNTTPPDYANEQGFLYQLGVTDELLAQNFNDININATAKAKVGLPWQSHFSGIHNIPYTFFQNYTGNGVTHEYGYLYRENGDMVDTYFKGQVRAPSPITIQQIPIKIHPMMEPKPETKVALDVDGSYFMFENQAESIVLSADKMEASRATDLAGAVWVYGDHIPQNKNDGTKVELARDEIVLSGEPIKVSEIPIGAKVLSGVKNSYHDILGKNMEWLVVDRNHEGYPANSTTLYSARLIVSAFSDLPNETNYNSPMDNYFLSDVDQWLNSEQPEGMWWSSQSTNDVEPTPENVKKYCDWLYEYNPDFGAKIAPHMALSPYAGFSYMLDDYFKNAVLTTHIKAEANRQLVEDNRRFFPPSMSNYGAYSEGEDSLFSIINIDKSALAVDFSDYLNSGLGELVTRKDRSIRVRGAIGDGRSANYGSRNNPDAWVSMSTSFASFFAPVCNISSDTIAYRTAEPNTFAIIDPKVKKEITGWDTSKDLYARQFTYNAKKHYQTSMDGAVAFLSRPTLRIGDLPSKSVVRLGRYEGNELTWWTTKDVKLDQYLVLSLESASISDFKGIEFDNKEPSNQDLSRQAYGNNNYVLSNTHQWLNSANAANAWYIAQHPADAEPTFANKAGFLNQWNDKEKSVLVNKEWSVKKPNLDGGGISKFYAKVVLPSATELAIKADTEGTPLDVFNSDSDRIVANSYYYSRSPVVDHPANVYAVSDNGKVFNQPAISRGTQKPTVRPIVSISPDTPVYEQPNEDGSYNICLTSPDDFESASSKVYVYSDTAPTNKSLMWIQKGSNVLYVHNGTNWMPITGVYGGGN